MPCLVVTLTGKDQEHHNLASSADRVQRFLVQEDIHNAEVKTIDQMHALLVYISNPYESDKVEITLQNCDDVRTVIKSELRFTEYPYWAEGLEHENGEFPCNEL